MSLRLPRFDRNIPLVEKTLVPSLTHQQWWDTVLKQIEKSVTNIEFTLGVAGIALDGSRVFPPFQTKTITTDNTLDIQDSLVLVDAAAGAIVVTLPPAADKEGFVITVKKIDSSGNAVTVDPDGSETIDGATTKTLTSQYEVARVASDGTSWWLV